MNMSVPHDYRTISLVDVESQIESEMLEEFLNKNLNNLSINTFTRVPVAAFTNNS